MVDQTSLERVPSRCINMVLLNTEIIIRMAITYKNFQQHGQHPNGPANNQIPTGPQVRASEGTDETK